MTEFRTLTRLAFLLSGTAALIFETLWFRQAGLVFGNSVSASAVVLAAFMAGLGAGNGIAARFGHRIRRPFRTFALVEIAIGVTGTLIVLLFPKTAALVAPTIRSLFQDSFLLHPVRMLLGFLVLALPATAMGLTLPLMVQALSGERSRDRAGYGETLGGLYGWNTLGGVAGAVGGHALVVQFGMIVAAVGAATLNGGVALLALALSRRFESIGSHVEPVRKSSKNGRTPLLFAAFLTGGILLALEVVWFRFLHLFVHSTSLAFALMLAAVLAGIGVGGAASGIWLKRRPDADRYAGAVAFGCGALTLLLYLGFDSVLGIFDKPYLGAPTDVLLATSALAFPTALLSGVLFTFTGTALNRVISPPSRSTGLLALANTVGAGLGPACAGFILLPAFGVEGSTFFLGCLYGIAGIALVYSSRPLPPATGGVTIAGAILFAAATLSFPFGKMEARYLPIVAERYGYPRTARIAGIREGRTETILYLENNLGGAPTSYQLITDGFSMASSSVFNRRYMKLFVYWPVALHPAPRKALLISYGVGSTAEALTDTRALRKIDIVDISRDVMEMSQIVHANPGSHPLTDPRVTVYIEDGRYYLQSTDERYDLITSEPPPPKHAGVVNLYTKEYFQLIYDRLADGGINTYWLPTHTLRPCEAKAIIRAYCEVFADCSLWGGTAYNWNLIGSRNSEWPKSEAVFAQQWEDPVVSRELRSLGFDRPELIGSLFMYDAAGLERLTADTEPLEDRYPGRLGPLLVDEAEQSSTYGSWMETSGTRRRFEQSAFIQGAWPQELRESTLSFFSDQQIMHEVIDRRGGRGVPPQPNEYVGELHHLLTETDLYTLPLWHLNVWDDVLSAIDRLIERGAPRDNFLPQLAARALANRDYKVAADLYHRAIERNGPKPALLYLGVYALAADNRHAEAEALAKTAPASLLAVDPAYWRWMEQTFGVRHGSP